MPTPVMLVAPRSERFFQRSAALGLAYALAQTPQLLSLDQKNAMLANIHVTENMIEALNAFEAAHGTASDKIAYFGTDDAGAYASLFDEIWNLGISFANMKERFNYSDPAKWTALTQQESSQWAALDNDLKAIDALITKHTPKLMVPGVPTPPGPGQVAGGPQTTPQIPTLAYVGAGAVGLGILWLLFG